MNEIETMLTGKMSMKDFVALLENNGRIRQEIRELVPEDAKHNPSHPFWKIVAYPFLQPYDFDLLTGLMHICFPHGYNNTIEQNLNVFSTIRTAYRYYKPDLTYTSMYEQQFDLYLTVIHDCFDGPEVKDFVEQIIQEALMIKGKGKQVAFAKEKIKELFQEENTKQRPYWIQGPEWPCGQRSPMKFIERKRHGEAVAFTFLDIDTGEMRTVTQYY